MSTWNVANLVKGKYDFNFALNANLSSVEFRREWVWNKVYLKVLFPNLADIYFFNVLFLYLFKKSTDFEKWKVFENIYDY